MRFDVISIFPEMFSALTEQGITARAIQKNLVEVAFWNPRDFSKNTHRRVDDRPYGGGPGMLMMVEPMVETIRAARHAVKNERTTCPVVYLSPQGKKLDQQAVKELASYERLILLSGRYEGVDERILDLEVDREVSIGDYVLSGGELPSMVLMDAIIRLLPNVLGHPESANQDSFSMKEGSVGLLDCPHYSRPANFEGLSVPEVLLNGNHEKIAQWRKQASLCKTRIRRPDLIKESC
jgi:tRNA (guanine37-N1)-methyltransferase